jgi:hypothetical protein
MNASAEEQRRPGRARLNELGFTLIDINAEQNRLNPCRGKPFVVSEELKFEGHKGNSRLNSNVRVDRPAEGRAFCCLTEAGGNVRWMNSSRSYSAQFSAPPSG